MFVSFYFFFLFVLFQSRLIGPNRAAVGFLRSPSFVRVRLRFFAAASPSSVCVGGAVRTCLGHRRCVCRKFIIYNIYIYYIIYGVSLQILKILTLYIQVHRSVRYSRPFCDDDHDGGRKVVRAARYSAVAAAP